MLARVLLSVLLVVPSMANADPVEQALARTRALLADPCKKGTSDEIVVCARRSSDDAYRLPLVEDDDAGFDTHARRGEVPNASADRLNGKGCGIFEGQRRCSKAEMRAYGYGGGLDPFSLLLKLGTILADPDADVAQPPRRRLKPR